MSDLVETAIRQVNGRFPAWDPTPAMLGYARAVAATVAALASSPASDDVVERVARAIFEAYHACSPLDDPGPINWGRSTDEQPLGYKITVMVWEA